MKISQDPPTPESHFCQKLTKYDDTVHPSPEDSRLPRNTRFMNGPPRILKIEQLYYINEGKITCNGIIRKWKFCEEIKELADRSFS